MSIRQKINDNPVIVGSVSAVLVVIAILLAVWQFSGSGTNRTFEVPDQSFFSDDDGKTWFVDSSTKIAPFDHNGKKAYQAELYRCGTNKPFVAYLVKYPDDQKKRMESELKAGGKTVDVVASGLGYMQIKGPGEKTWVTRRGEAAEFARLTHPKCPDGSTPTHLKGGEKTD